jgi:hypothetical protein
MTQESNVFVLSIPLNAPASPDLRDILKVIGEDITSNLIWGVTQLEAIGPEEVQDFLSAVDANPILVPGRRLLELAQKIKQTIEGVFMGYASEADAQEFLQSRGALSGFSSSLAEMAIQAIDSSVFDVYLRSLIYADRLAQRFPGVRWENPDTFLV